MKTRVYDYDDRLKLFMEVTLRKVPYLEDLEEDILHELMFAMTETMHPRGS